MKWLAAAAFIFVAGSGLFGDVFIYGTGPYCPGMDPSWIGVCK